ncbi:MAG: hypothetical protein KDA60_14790, partial [Planctomycetales bacterium]|nr:hypothetical protein [Planctomycetales bacterium]
GTERIYRARSVWRRDADGDVMSGTDFETQRRRERREKGRAAGKFSFADRLDGEDFDSLLEG